MTALSMRRLVLSAWVSILFAAGSGPAYATAVGHTPGSFSVTMPENSSNSSLAILPAMRCSRLRRAVGGLRAHYSLAESRLSSALYHNSVVRGTALQAR